MALDDPSLKLQTKFVNVLRAGGTLAGKRFYCPVPEDREFPYGDIGEIQIIKEPIEGFSGAEVYVTVNLWSQKNSRVEIRTLGAQVIALFDDDDEPGAHPLSDNELGLVVNSCLLSQADYIDDPDGKTAHGILIFHVLTD